MRRRSPLILLTLAAVLAACGTGVAAHSGGSTAASTATTAAPARTTAAAAKAAAPARVHLVKVASFEQPVYVTGARGDASRVFVVQKDGQVMLLVHGHVQQRPFLDISKLVESQGGEQGLLGLAFAPDYASSGIFYVDYTIAGNDIRVARYQRSASDPDVANAASAHVLLSVDHHRNTNHNAGQLAFGPEGDLYIGVGDGGSEDDPENNGQNTNTLLGKILRIEPTPNGGYRVPASNPFAARAGSQPTIWAYGLRNPWRFSFDRANGALIIGDVGQDLEEEIDYAPAGSGRGANYGWSVWEGDRRNKPGAAAHAVFPVLIARHSGGYCAIIGGYVVRDRSLPGLYGRFLFGDYCRPQIEAVTLGRGSARGLHATGLEVSATSSLGEDGAGHIYITSLDGPLYRIAGG